MPLFFSLQLDDVFDAVFSFSISSWASIFVGSWWAITFFLRWLKAIFVNVPNVSLLNLQVISLYVVQLFFKDFHSRGSNDILTFDLEIFLRFA
jgi:hypothetical protein